MKSNVEFQKFSLSYASFIVVFFKASTTEAEKNILHSFIVRKAQSFGISIRLQKPHRRFDISWFDESVSGSSFIEINKLVVVVVVDNVDVDKMTR